MKFDINELLGVAFGEHNIVSLNSIVVGSQGNDNNKSYQLLDHINIIHIGKIGLFSTRTTIIQYNGC